jgi:AraC-like DNA-binding protein
VYQSFPDVSIFSPPYEALLPWSGSTQFPDGRGKAVVWYLHDAELQREQYRQLKQRPPALPLFIILPPADAIEPILAIVPILNDLHARGVLPNGPISTVEPLRLLLRHAPRDLPSFMVGYLTRRNILGDSKARSIVSKFFELAPTITSISGVARRLYTSRRTLGRFFEARQLPVPSHWLQFARLLYVATRLQADEATPVFRVATQFRYPDGFTMSNQMKRLVGCRPSEVREYLGYEWFIEEWLKLERNRTNS